jgi:hypothetical protein
LNRIETATSICDILMPAGNGGICGAGQQGVAGDREGQR